MKTSWTTWYLVLAVAVLGCESTPEPGKICASSENCGWLNCYCDHDGAVQGVCSQECTDDADCSHFGDDHACVDFGSGGECGMQKICLPRGD